MYNGIIHYRRDTSSGSLSFVNFTRFNFTDSLDALVGTYAMCLSPDEKHLYTIAPMGTIDHNPRFHSGMVSWFGFDGLTDSLVYIDRISSNQAGVQGLGGAYHIYLHPNQKKVYVFSSYYILDVFTRDPGNGSLTYDTTYKGGWKGFPGFGSGINSLALSQDGTLLFASIEGDSFSWSRLNPVTNELTLGGIFYDSILTKDIYNNPTQIEVSPDDRQVYVPAPDIGAIYWFERGSVGSNTLAFQKVFVDTAHLQGFSFFKITHDGKQLIAQGPRGIFLYNRNWVDGTLSLADSINSFFLNNCLAESPDGKGFYFAHSPDKIDYYSRDTVSGLFAERNSFSVPQELSNQSFSLPGLFFNVPGDMAYLTTGDTGLFCLKRDTATGALSYLGGILSSEYGPAFGAAVCSDDSRFLYSLISKSSYPSKPGRISWWGLPGYTKVERSGFGNLSTNLSQNIPNPFNPITRIQYILQDQCPVRLSVYNMAGRLVKTLVNENQMPGQHTVVWSAAGQPSGVYLYRITAGKFRAVKKAVLLK
jgi:hypothetical protein